MELCFDQFKSSQELECWKQHTWIQHFMVCIYLQWERLMPAAGRQNIQDLYYLWTPERRNKNVCSSQKRKVLNTERKTRRYMCPYYWSMVHQKRTQSPREAQPQQDVKDIAAYRVGHRHVAHTWKEKKKLFNLMQWEEKLFKKRLRWLFCHLPCRATIRLAMQSGTLVPAARKVIPMM